MELDFLGCNAVLTKNTGLEIILQLGIKCIIHSGELTFMLWYYVIPISWKEFWDWGTFFKISSTISIPRWNQTFQILWNSLGCGWKYLRLEFPCYNAGLSVKYWGTCSLVVLVSSCCRVRSIGSYEFLVTSRWDKLKVYH